MPPAPVGDQLCLWWFQPDLIAHTPDHLTGTAGAV